MCSFAPIPQNEKTMKGGIWMKRRIWCVCALFLIISLLSGCFNRIPGENWQNPNLKDHYSFVNVMVGDTSIEEWHDNNVITRVAWQKLGLYSNHGAVYSNLSEAFDKYNAESLTEAKALMYELSSYAEEMNGEQPLYL